MLYRGCVNDVSGTVCVQMMNLGIHRVIQVWTFWRIIPLCIVCYGGSQLITDDVLASCQNLSHSHINVVLIPLHSREQEENLHEDLNRKSLLILISNPNHYYKGQGVLICSEGFIYYVFVRRCANLQYPTLQHSMLLDGIIFYERSFLL